MWPKPEVIATRRRTDRYSHRSNPIGDARTTQEVVADSAPRAAQPARLGQAGGVASSPSSVRSAALVLSLAGWHYAAAMVLRLVLAEDSYLMRDGINALLGLDDGVDVVASCEDYDTLLAAVEEHLPDVVLTDIRMPPSQTDEGVRAADVIRSTHPEVGVVVLSQYVEPEYARRLFEHGSDGRAYLLKERVADLDELGGVLRRVADGGSVVDPKVVEALIGVEASRKSDALDRLTDRERDVLAEMATGKSNSSIGEALFISARSVEKHINAIFTKLDLVQTDDVHRRVQAVLVFIGLGVADRG